MQEKRILFCDFCRCCLLSRCSLSSLSSLSFSLSFFPLFSRSTSVFFSQILRKKTLNGLTTEKPRQETEKEAAKEI